MKKLLVILLAAILISTLAACSKTTTPTTPPSPSPTAEPTSALVEASPIPTEKPAPPAIDTTGKTSTEGIVHFGDSFGLCTLWYDDASWAAQCINESTDLNEVISGQVEFGTLSITADSDSNGTAMLPDIQSLYYTANSYKSVEANGISLRYNKDFWSASIDGADYAGTIADGTLTAAKGGEDRLADIQAYYSSIAGKTFDGEAEFMTGSMPIVFWYNDAEWSAVFDITEVGVHAELSGTIADKVLSLVSDNTGGFGETLVKDIQNLYDLLVGKTVVGNVDFMGTPTEVTLTYTATEFTASFYFALANDDVTLSGTIADGTLTVAEDSTGGAGSDLIKEIQTQLYDPNAGTSGGGDPGGDPVLEIVVPDLSNMQFFVEDIDFNGMAQIPAIIGFNDTDYVIAYYFDLASSAVTTVGKIAGGELDFANSQSSNAYGLAEDMLPNWTKLYNDAVADGTDIAKTTADLDFNGMAVVPATLHYTDTFWAATYYFEMANLNVILTGKIDGGQLVMQTDSSGMAADLLAQIQGVYGNK
jgi:hypothetical protein